MNREEKERNYELAEKLISEQNFLAAVIVGGVTTMFAAVIYGIVVSLWSFSYGFAAAGIGIAVGISMQWLGRGIEKKFAVVASVYTIAGCLLGNVYRTALYEAQANAVPLFEAFQSNSYSVFAEWSVVNVSFIELFFWFVAVWFAVFLVERPLSRPERLAVGMYEIKN